MYKYFFKTFKENIKYWLISLFALSLFLWYTSASDLLRQITEPSYEYDTIIAWLGHTKEAVWESVFKNSLELEVGASVFKKVPVKDDDGNVICKGECPEDCKKETNNNDIRCRKYRNMKTTTVSLEAWIWTQPSLIVKVTRFLLILTITLSVTMILYNGMMYIIQTWQWKDWKSLKNVAYIVIWILIALFSVIMIRVIQSISTTIADQQELPENWYELDKQSITNGEWSARAALRF